MKHFSPLVTGQASTNAFFMHLIGKEVVCWQVSLPHVDDGAR